MKQLNINVTPELDRDLREYMKQNSIRTKSDAIRRALHEAVKKRNATDECDYRSWLGLGLKAPPRQKRRFNSEDELWS